KSIDSVVDQLLEACAAAGNHHAAERQRFQARVRQVVDFRRQDDKARVLHQLQQRSRPLRREDEDPAIDEIAQLAADQRIEEKLAADPARWAGEEKLEIGIALEQPGQHANQAIAALEITQGAEKKRVALRRERRRRVRQAGGRRRDFERRLDYRDLESF